MTNPIAITRKNYWQVNGTNHSTEVEAFEDASNQAIANPGAIVQVQPPMYDVVYTAPITAQPPVTPPPVDPPPTTTPPVTDPPVTTPPVSTSDPAIGAPVADQAAWDAMRPKDA